jgi:hypothetical protein
MINGYDACKILLALKLHYTSPSYDYFKYDGSVSLTPSGYAARKDRYFCEKLAHKYKTKINLVDFATTVYAHSDRPKKLWTNNFLSKDAETCYDKMSGWTEGLEYHFKNELEKMIQVTVDNGQSINWPITVRNGEEPPLLQMYRQNDISLECVALLNNMFHLIEQWNNKITDDLLYPELANKIQKYTPFVVARVELEIYQRIIFTTLDGFPTK